MIVFARGEYRFDGALKIISFDPVDTVVGPDMYQMSLVFGLDKAEKIGVKKVVNIDFKIWTIQNIIDRQADIIMS